MSLMGLLGFMGFIGLLGFMGLLGLLGFMGFGGIYIGQGGVLLGCRTDRRELTQVIIFADKDF